MKQWLLNLPLALKSALIVTLLCLLASLLTLGIALKTSDNLLRETSHRYLQELSQQLANQLRVLMLEDDRIGLQTQLREFTRQGFYAHATVHDDQGRLLAEMGAPQRQHWSALATISAQGEPLGVVELSVDPALLRNEITLLGVVLLALTLVIAAIMFALISSPMSRIARWLQDARALMDNPLAERQRCEYPADDELGSLLKSIHDRRMPLPPEEHHSGVRMLVLQVHWRRQQSLKSSWDAARYQQLLKENYERAAALAHVYNAEYKVLRSDGLTLLWRVGMNEAEALFHSLCSAWLLEQFGESLQAQGHICQLETEGSRWQITADECQLADKLSNSSDEHKGTKLHLSEAQKALIEEWAELSADGVEQIRQPWQGRLERQLNRLRQSSGAE